jgi:hypothetical protein
MGKVRARKAGSKEPAERGRSEDVRTRAGSGEGAESALANLREIERTRSQCEPADDVLPASAGHPAATMAPLP